MKILSIGTDRNIFKDGEARARQIEYGSIFDELHIIIFSLKKLGLKPQKISSNVWIYPTDSFLKVFYIFSALRIGKSILKSENKGDWVVTSQDPFETGFVSLMLSKIFKVKLNIQIHTNFLSKYFIKSSFLNSFRVFIARWVLKKANSIRTVSQEIKDGISEIRGLTEKIMVLPMFIDVKNIIEAKTSFDLRQKFSQFDFIVLSVARLESEKNFELALEIISEIIKKIPKVGYVIVGEGSLREKLEEKAKELNITENVLFEGWQKDVISYYKGADLFLNNSFFEGYSRSIIESASSGTPILSSPVGPVGEVLMPGRDVLVCNVSDKDCFKTKIEKILLDEKLRFDLSEKAKESVLKSYKTKEEYLGLYKKAITGDF